MNENLPPRWSATPDYAAICSLLIQLGVQPHYLGLRQTAHCVYLCVYNPDKLSLVSKWLYPEVAKLCGATPKTVERNIRTAAQQAYKNNPALLFTLAGHALDKAPSSLQFLGIITFYFLQSPEAA